MLWLQVSTSDPAFEKQKESQNPNKMYISTILGQLLAAQAARGHFNQDTTLTVDTG